MIIFEFDIFWLTVAPSYYGFMYVLWFLFWYFIIKYRKKYIFSRVRKPAYPTKNNHLLDDLFIYIFFWVIIWWRLWYILFYNLSFYLSNLFDILKIWEWWMSFHGWVIGVIFAMFLFAKRYRINFFSLSDEVVSVVPIWLWLWRIWNYLNGELLWFSPYNWFLAVYKNWVWYFPSPILEAILEWLVLFVILNYFYNRNYLNNKWFQGQVSFLFLILYWFFRIFVELFFRVPDSNIWYLFWVFTVWEILSIPMVIFGVVWYWFLLKIGDCNKIKPLVSTKLYNHND